MPILTKFPGGGSSGYCYQVGNVIAPKALEGLNDTVELSWEDPADINVNGKTISEWKGTIVVCKKGMPPKSVEDGEKVCESTTRNQYKHSNLITDIGGPGYYYGIFPYTKDYVVNVGEENHVYIHAGLDASSWSVIADFSEKGVAGQYWKVGDEVKVPLSEPYNIEITMQIADFNHDDLSSGGKAGITFVSKEVFGNSRNYPNFWPNTKLREEMDVVYSAFPEDLKRVIKEINKKCVNGCYSSTSPTYATVQGKVFVPSWKEVAYDYLQQTLPSVVKTYSDEGSQYSIFTGGKERHIKKNMDGEAVTWWTRSVKLDKLNATPEYISIYVSGGTATSSGSSNKPFCIIFCV